MKNILAVLSFVILGSLAFAQHRQDIWELIYESDFIVIGEVEAIDTLAPEKHKHFDLGRNIADVKIDKIQKGKIAKENLKLFYYTTGGSHTRPAKPKVNSRYLFFLKYDLEKEYFILPSKAYSLINISPINEKVVAEIISDLMLNPNMNSCEFFDVLIKNLDEPILPINVALFNMSMYNDSLDLKCCIDFTKRQKLYEDFVETKNLYILPFLDSHYSVEVDEILLNEITSQLKMIKVSKEMYCIDETSRVINCLNEVSYLKGSQANKEIRELYETIAMGEHRQFVIKTREIIEKYEK